MPLVLVDDSLDTPVQILHCPTISQCILSRLNTIEFAFENSFASLSHIVAMSYSYLSPASWTYNLYISRRPHVRKDFPSHYLLPNVNETQNWRSTVKCAHARERRHEAKQINVQLQARYTSKIKRQMQTEIDKIKLGLSSWKCSRWVRSIGNGLRWTGSSR